MYTKIRAQPTEYKGIRYRSKLEAQWALYLTLINVPFEYEAETFDLGDRRYTPDFRINKRLWLEVKPRIFTIDTLEKVTMLATTFNTKVALCAGDFYDGLHIAVVQPGGTFTFNYQFAFCPKCNGMKLTNTSTCPVCYHTLVTFGEEWKHVKRHKFDGEQKRGTRKKT